MNEAINIIAGDSLVSCDVQNVYRVRLRFNIISGSSKQLADDDRVNRCIEAAQRYAAKRDVEVSRCSDGLGCAVRNDTTGEGNPFIEFTGANRDDVIAVFRRTCHYVARYPGHVFNDADRKDGTQ